MANILVACEESQAVCKAFRERGHNAFSCDIQPCSGGHPEWHILGDVRQFVIPTDYGNPYDIKSIDFMTEDFEFHSVDSWDLVVAHPPCTFLAVSGNSWFNVSKYGEKAIERMKERDSAIGFFSFFVHLPIKRICIENPIGTINSIFPCTQIIQPYWFGDPERKSTCLWLKGLPKLRPTNVVKPNLYYYKDYGSVSSWHMNTINLPADERRKLRSKTFPGIANAMASQWGDLFN